MAVSSPASVVPWSRPKLTIVEHLLEEKDTWKPCGSMRVFCNGFFIIGPVRSWWWLLEIYTICVTAIFFAEHENYAIYLTILGGVGFLICTISSWKALLCDPGIVKRPSFEEAMENATEIQRMINAGVPYPTKRVDVGESIETYTYCLDCHHFRPPRTGHCYECDCCVEKFDHFCPVVGLAVGGKNYNAFLVMTCAMSFYHFYLLMTGIGVLVTYAKRTGDKYHVGWWTASITLNVTIIGFILACILPGVLNFLPCEQQQPRRRQFNRWIFGNNTRFGNHNYSQTSRPSQETSVKAEESNENGNLV